jgi:hypothetical protein
MKGLTTKPGTCGCGKALPIPRATSKNICDECRDSKVRIRTAKWAKKAYHRDPEKFQARAQARRAKDPEPGRRYARDFYHDHAQEIKDRKNARYRANPKKYRAAARRSAKKNPTKTKARQAKAWLRRRELIALGKSMLTSQNRPVARRGRRIEQKTLDNISLAAHLMLRGLKPYAMTDLLYPPDPNLAKQQTAPDRRRRFEAQSKFLEKYRKRIDLERQQLAAAQNAVSSRS